MIYTVIKQLEFNGKLYYKGDKIKLTDEEAKTFKSKISKNKIFTK